MQERQTQDSQRADENAGSRALLGAALAVLILYVVALIALGTPPGAGDTGEQVVAWFREHRDGARWSVWAGAVGTLPFAVMFAILRRLLPPPHRDVFFFRRHCMRDVICRAVVDLGRLGAACQPARTGDGPNCPRCSVILRSGSYRRDDHDDGASHSASVARSGGLAAMARRLRRDCVC